MIRWIIFQGFLFHLILLTLKAGNVNQNQLFDSYDVKFYFIDIHASNQNTDIAGNTEIFVQITNPLVDTIAFELTKNAIVDSILSNNIKSSFYQKEDTIIIIIPESIGERNLLNFRVYYSIHGVNSRKGRGINTGKVEGNRTLTWTLTEPYYAKDWFPCKQDLKDKADSVYIFITVSDSLKVGSNGLLTDIKKLSENLIRFEWKSFYPVEYYLISFSVGDYMDYSIYAYTGNYDSILVQNYIYNDSNYFWNNKEEIDQTAGLISLFSEKFGDYPFKKEKYGHCLAPIGGGMENQTMTTLSNFNFELVAHELAHQWFGDNVTCSDWQNIWINEGFASYGELVGLEKFYSKKDVEDWLNSSSSSARMAKTGSVYVPADQLADEQRIFDHSLTYQKGAYILHMIRHEINNDVLFFDVIKSYQSVFAFSVASADDFKNLLETKTGIAFDHFFNQWFYGEGYPILNLNWERKNDSIVFEISQKVTAPEITPFFDLLIDLKLEYLGGDTTVQVRLTQPSQKFSIPFNLSVYRIMVDPDQWILREIEGINRVFSEGKTSNFIIFPNPADKEVYIENLESGKPFFVKIYDIKGIIRFETEGYDFFTNINLEGFEPGVYQLIISYDDLKEYFKLVKT